MVTVVIRRGALFWYLMGIGRQKRKFQVEALVGLER